jgi:hypothetical protein
MYVAEYNPRQKQIHIEKKEEKIEKVLRAFKLDEWKNESEWMVFFEGSYKECGDASKQLTDNLCPN